MAIMQNIIQVGKVALTDQVSSRPIKDISLVTVEYRSDSNVDFLPCPFSERLDGQGNLLLLSSRPAIDLLREFEDDDYHFRIQIQATAHQEKTVTFTVTKASWDAYVAQVEALQEGTLATSWQLLFDEADQLEPNPVAAELSLRRQNHQALDPDDYVLEVTAPSSVNGQAVGSLNVWKFYPLPIADKVTVQVRLSADDSVITSAEFGIDYAQTLNVWDLPINH
ncbi:hypothetical protein [Pleionea sp. CnH1-48]|uniref:hypothetical protein n=1 Tax=Pleionea sp. CnH1-48 TaxID=2954494 RepID=UPI002097DC21|nr:hypothetical protein [Pleionea sp. CnH1-48]MCO7223334.1 hypothetical protein [Pleionea sp. CnH1-48]